jgi:hypothetical protein
MKQKKSRLREIFFFTSEKIPFNLGTGGDFSYREIHPENVVPS